MKAVTQCARIRLVWRAIAAHGVTRTCPLFRIFRRPAHVTPATAGMSKDTHPGVPSTTTPIKSVQTV